MTPGHINKRIATFLKKESEAHLTESALSKTLAQLKESRILESVQGKLNIHQKFPNLYPRGRGKSEKTKGFPIRYKITDNVKDYIRVLNDPATLELINQNLSSYSLLGEFYRTVSNDILDLILEHGDPTTYEFFSIAMTPLNPDKIPSQSDWDVFRDKLSKLSNERREELVNEMTTAFLQNPQALLFLLFSLTQKNYDQK